MSLQIAKRHKGKGSRHPKGLTLERFAAAKSSGYNKRERIDKQFALDAKKVNKYRKLKSKLQQKGVLSGASQADQQEAVRLRKIQERAGSPLADDMDEESELNDIIQQQHQLPHAKERAELEDGFATASQHQPSASRHDAAQAPSLPLTHTHSAQQTASQLKPGKANRHKRQKPESHLQKLANQVQADKEAALQEQQMAQRAAAERRAKVADVEKQRKKQTTLLRKKTRSGQPVMKHRIDKILDALQQ